MATRRKEEEESHSLNGTGPFLFGLTLQDALFLGFCATFIVITRTGLRLHLKIPGHAMVFTMFFLILGRGCVRKHGAATLIGLAAGCVAVLLGMGKGGPLALLKFVIPAAAVDAGAALCPAVGVSYIVSLLIGMLASATRIVTLILVEWLMGMDSTVIFQHAVISGAMGMGFGGLGGVLVPPVVRRLRLHGLIH